jgi:hypothetical protein
VRLFSTEKSFLVPKLALSLYLIFFHLQFFMLSQWIWGEGGMIFRDLIVPPTYSLLFVSAHPALSYILNALLVGLSVVVLTTTRHASLVYAVMFLIHTSLLNANILVIHEPHQLVQLLIVYHGVQSYYLKQDRKLDPVVAKLWLGFVLLFYFLAGLKKLPDSLWRTGESLQVLMDWNGLARPIAQSLVSSLPKWILQVGVYLVLLFELSAPLCFFNRKIFRSWLRAACLFHLCIWALIDVGYFSVVMLICLSSIFCFATTDSVDPKNEFRT